MGRRVPSASASSLSATSPRREADDSPRQAPWCRIMAGGAVLTEDYARRIGADFYGRDAMSDVRYADSVAAGD